MKTYQTLFVERFVGFRMIEQPVTVQAKDMQEAKAKFAQLARESRQAWITKRIRLAA